MKYIVVCHYTTTPSSCTYYTAICSFKFTTDMVHSVLMYDFQYASLDMSPHSFPDIGRVEVCMLQCEKHL